MNVSHMRACACARMCVYVYTFIFFFVTFIDRYIYLHLISKTYGGYKGRNHPVTGL